jgi:hypothetical protein
MNLRNQGGATKPPPENTLANETHPMINSKSVRSLLALSLLAAAPLAAQTGGRAEGAPRAERAMGRPGAEGRAFTALINRRRELNLTDAQVARLTEIGRRLEERNRPIRERLATERQRYAQQRRAELERLSPEQRRDTLRQLRGQRGERRARQVPETMRQPMEQLRANIRQATTEAQSVLNDDQKRRARELMVEQRGKRGREGRAGRRDEGRRDRGDRPAPAARP